MADSFVQIPPDSTGKLIDAASMDVGANSVLRQRIVLADNAGTATFAVISPTNPLGTEAGLVVRNIPSGTQFIDGNINISATALVSGTVILGAGTDNIGTLNNISATVVTGLSYVVEKTTNSQVQVGDSANAAIRVNIVAGTAAGVSQIDGTTFSSQAANFTPIGGIFDDTGTDTLSENDAGIVRLTTARAFHTNLRTSAGVAMEDTANAAVRVSIMSGGGTGGTSQNDTTSFNAASSAFNPIGGYFDDVAPSTLAENSGGAVRMTTNRAFHTNMRTDGGVNMDDSANNALRVSIVSDLSTTATVAGTVNILGVVSHGAAAAPLMPILQGFLANNSMQTGVTSGQAVMAWADGFGRQVVINNATSNVPSVSRGPICVTLSVSATTQVIANPGAATSIYITMIAATNGSGTLTVGYLYAASQTSSCIAKLHLAANGGGFTMNYDPPIQVPANTVLNGRVKPNVSETLWDIHFYVGPS